MLKYVSYIIATYRVKFIIGTTVYSYFQLFYKLMLCSE